MKRAVLVAAAASADAVAGDPEWFPHPVRFIGRFIADAERALRRPQQSPRSEFLLGAVLSVATVAGTYRLTKQSITLARRCSPWLGEAVELFWAWTCLAAQNLSDEAGSVVQALEASDLPLARQRVARIVGRDTEQLDTADVSRAVIETVAESLSDGVVAPMFYLALGGAPLAMAYKAVNTLDSMTGHADSRYLYFGKFAARMDDVANYMPARLSALMLVAASGRPTSSLTTWLRDGDLHKSPNAGQPESAMSGALRVALGGGNRYAGEYISAPRMGAEFARPTPRDARASINMMVRATIVFTSAAVAALALAEVLRKRGAAR